MALPILTPKSNQSAITLPSTGSTGDVTTALAIGFYSGSAFQAGAASQVAYTFKRLGGDVLDIELTAGNIYNHYEEACLEYSYIVNLHQARNALGSALGGATGSFDNKGTLSGTDNASLKYPKFQFDYAFRIADGFSSEALKQFYDLQSIVSSSAVTGGVAFSDINRHKRIKVREVFYVSPRQMWRFYGYYGGLNVVGDFHNYGQYADDSTFNVIPAWQNKAQAISYEDHLYTRTSHYSYEIIDNKLKLYPTPDDTSPDEIWFRFTVEDNDAFSESSYDSGLKGINNMNTLPFENIPFTKINSMGQQWIRKFSLALSKETLGQVRGKFGGTIPIPGETVSLNASDLLSQAAAEQSALKEELNKQLDETLYSKLAETDKAMVDNTDAIVGKSPLKIYVG